jgi:hypothetical protein
MQVRVVACLPRENEILSEKINKGQKDVRAWLK